MNFRKDYSSTSSYDNPVDNMTTYFVNATVEFVCWVLVLFGFALFVCSVCVFSLFFLWPKKSLEIILKSQCHPKCFARLCFCFEVWLARLPDVSQLIPCRTGLSAS